MTIFDQSNPARQQNRFQAGITSQFRRPHGIMGALAGWIMENRRSNIDRNYWTVGLLALEADADVLEVGCGPGVGITATLKVAPGIRVTGLDHSSLMISKAAGRHAEALRTDRLTLWQGDLASLPPGSTYDAVFSCNVLQFIEDRRAFLEGTKVRLKPGGTFASTYQPRGQCASAEEGRAWISAFAEDLVTAGYRDVDVREKRFGTMPAYCAFGQR